MREQKESPNYNTYTKNLPDGRECCTTNLGLKIATTFRSWLMRKKKTAALAQNNNKY